MAYSTIFFDLDDTLYPSSTGIWSTIRERMNAYMLERLHIPPEQVAALRHFYFETYGTTLRGLQHHYNVDAADFLGYVHDLPIESILKPDPGLRSMLLSLPQRRFIFTNSDYRHAGRVLSSLGISDCFESVIDIWAMDFHCKPEPDAYHLALKHAGMPEPRECLYIDDSARNLEPAGKLGICTILIGSEHSDGSACRRIHEIRELQQVFPELWEGGLHGSR